MIEPKGKIANRRELAVERAAKKQAIEDLNGVFKTTGVADYASDRHFPGMLYAVTAAPAKMLGIEGVKGTLEADADADLLVLDAVEDGEGKRELKVAKVWKFGTLVYDVEDGETALA